MSELVMWVWLLVGVAVLVGTGCEPSPVESPVLSYESEIARLDETIDAQRRRPVGAWERERLAGFYMARARLSGDLADYVEADRALGSAYEMAAEGSGPHLTKAKLAFTFHRLGEASEALNAAEQRVLTDNRLDAAILGLRGSIALQRGEYDASRVFLQRALERHPSFDAYARLGLYHGQTGDVDFAERAYERADSLLVSDPVGRAWVDLQFGLLDLAAERYEDALTHYRDAERHLAGWWLIDEHIAEVLALRGKRDEARALYRDLVARTGNPEFMSALAELVSAEEADGLITRAEAAHRERMALLPEAAIGHALDFFLEHGDDLDEVLAFATQNYEARPGGEAAVRLVLAYRQAGRRADADGLEKKLAATDFRGPDLKRLVEP